MKKLTGTMLITVALLAHVGIIIATEEAYTFSSNEYDITQTTVNTIAPELIKSEFAIPVSSGPTSVAKFGLLNFDEKYFAN